MDLDTFLSAKATVNAAELARFLNEKPSNVSLWRHKKKPVPPYKAILIEKYTNGVVSRKDLRPHDWQKIWPELSDD